MENATFHEKDKLDIEHIEGDLSIVTFPNNDVGISFGHITTKDDIMLIMECKVAQIILLNRLVKAVEKLSK